MSEDAKSTKGWIVPNNSSEAYSVLEVRVKPILAPQFLLVAFKDGDRTIHVTTDKSIVEGISPKELEAMQELERRDDKRSEVMCDYTNPRNGLYHLTAIRPAP